MTHVADPAADPGADPGAGTPERAPEAAAGTVRRLGRWLDGLVSGPGEVAGAALRSPTALPVRSLLRAELLIVLALSFGRSAVGAVLNLIDDLTTAPLRNAHPNLNPTITPDRPYLDLAYQLFFVGFGVVVVFLVGYLLTRSGERGLARLGLDATRPRFDLGAGLALAAIVGGVGLGLFVAAYQSGASATVVLTSLPAVWWRVPVLVLSAAQNAVAEEVVVLGYLVRRLDQLGWNRWLVLATSGLLRGSYHLYQGFGGFVGNAAMGALFVVLYRRWRRVGPMVVAHTTIDAVSFVGYLALRGHVSFLPA